MLDFASDASETIAALQATLTETRAELQKTQRALKHLQTVTNTSTTPRRATIIIAVEGGRILAERYANGSRVKLDPNELPPDWREDLLIEAETLAANEAAAAASRHREIYTAVKSAHGAALASRSIGYIHKVAKNGDPERGWNGSRTIVTVQPQATRAQRCWDQITAVKQLLTHANAKAQRRQAPTATEAEITAEVTRRVLSYGFTNAEITAALQQQRRPISNVSQPKSRAAKKLSYTDADVPI